MFLTRTHANIWLPNFYATNREELYDNKEDQARSMQTYTAFFNTEPQLGALIVGITAGLEEARANGSEEVDDETINGLRAGLMDQLQVSVTLLSLVL